MSRLTITKSKYPTKTTINLAMDDQQHADPKLQIGLFVLFLILLAVFVKFAVVDRLQAANHAEAEYRNIEHEISALDEATADYNQVRQQYSQYSTEYLTPEEAAEMDRMEVIDLMDSCIASRANVQNVSVSEYAMTVTINNTDLNTVSAIVSALQNDDRTAFVTVSTAGTGTGNSDSTQISANIVVTLAGGVDESAAAAESAETSEDETGGADE